MTRIISSRPEESIGGLDIDAMSLAELELISSFLWCTKLGGSSIYQDAAFNLINKIAAVAGDDFLENAAENVALQVHELDSRGHHINTIQQENLEFIV